MTAGTPAVAVVDGGKSQVRLVIEGPQDRWSATGPGFNYRPGSDDVTAIVASVVAAKAACGYQGRVDSVCVGLTGAPAAAGLRHRLITSLTGMFGGTVRLVNDGVLAHAGALDRPGVVICAGTGVVAFAVASDGQWARTDGWGYLLGDRGSGFAIGRAGLAAALAAVDGAAPPTGLTEAAAAHLGGLDVAAMQELLHDNDIPARIASFAVAVNRHAAVGDTVAREIIHRAAADLAHTAAAAARAVGLPADGTEVSYAGRLLHVGDPLLACLTEALSTLELQFVPPKGDALSGGLALARHPGRQPYERLLAAPFS